jgi:HPt (histidine-containing phosphotransfer) domain-containing protein
MSSEEIDGGALQRLLNVLGNDPEELKDLIEDYFEDAPELARRISSAAEDGDLQALRIAAHTLKSNARDVGALRLAALCADIEQSCNAGAHSDATAAARSVAEAEEAARRALTSVALDELGRASDTL